MRLILTFGSLFLSIAFLQLSSGAISPLDVLGGLQAGFSNAQVGLLGSAHFIGFFIGCWWSPRLMGRIGQARAFSVFATCGAIGAIAHPLLVEPLAWAALRVLTGLCVSGCYTVVESWLNASVTNANRGRALGAYRSVDLAASMSAQLMLVMLIPGSWVSYNFLGILCCACLIPVLLTQARQPAMSEAPRLRPTKILQVSPLGVAGAIVAGVTASSFRMVGPLYGQEVGLHIGQIGYFLAAFVLGGALAQFPIGWVADKYDRRWVLVVLSLLAAAACAGTVLLGTRSETAIFFAAFIFGFVTFPVFSIASAHVNDFAKSEDMVETSASLMFWFGLGAIASPLTASMLIELAGPEALFGFIAAAHLGLALFGAMRMLVRPTVADKTPYQYVPRTSFILGRLFKRSGRGR